MKNYTILLLLLCLLTSRLAAHNKPSCDSDSYSSEVLKETQISATCIEYEIKVSYDGTKSFGLSHYSIGIPCGEVKNFSNSENWKMVFGKDRTTGVYGLKVDDISGFGGGKADSFTVKFTWCSSSSCTKELGVVAYKAGTCVDYDTLSQPNVPDTTQTCSSLLASLQKKNATCSTANDGELTVSIQEGLGPFVYAWSNGSTTSTVQNLSAGMYAVTIKDAKGNTLTLTSEVSAPPPISITESIIDAGCSGSANGSIVLTVTGGSGEFTFGWSNGSTEQNQSDLISGFYTVVVADSTGCSVQKSFAITNAAVISAESVIDHPSCTQNDGSIDITPVGGAAPYSYLWNNGATTQDLQNLGAGNYRVTITDASGCLARKTYTLQISSTLSVNYDVTGTNCSSDTGGSIDLNIMGGTEPYSIKWLDGPTIEDRSGLAIGVYQVTVTDATGCSAQQEIAVSKQPLQVSSIIHQPACSGDLGSIAVTPTNGVAPYTYTWSNGETDDSITDLANGFYSVTITDAAGCSEVLSFFILTPPSAIDATGVITTTQCGAAGSFTIDVTVLGGRYPYTYLWSNGAITEDISGLNASSYSVDIKDALGCMVKKEFTINPVSNNGACLINPVTTPVVCRSAGNFLSTGVVGATTYSWTVSSTDNSWSITSGSSDSSAVYTAGNPGSAATFTLSVTKNGCTQTCTYTVTGGCIERDNTGGGDPSSTNPCTVPPTTPPVVVVPPVVEEPEPEEDNHHGCRVNIIHVYPNPFREKLKFEWSAPKNEKVRLEIFDGCGHRVAVVFEGNVVAGRRYSFDWSAMGLKDYVYYYRYTTPKNVEHGKLIRKR